MLFPNYAPTYFFSTLSYKLVIGTLDYICIFLTFFFFNTTILDKFSKNSATAITRFFVFPSFLDN